ncbi:unnamed protein product [Didymodactylos carnosus]|uniref:Uncharacterized protein n=1 Tax=Didymodactylos carnosus TaxID=1234261 RepID=A0A8S2D4I9_9BILA|nr:unnamed protein product [Didymodactylos carnosus]CAF3661166.1 unnamed protein product [Didymodactylos carnosus]
MLVELETAKIDTDARLTKARQQLTDSLQELKQFVNNMHEMTQGKATTVMTELTDWTISAGEPILYRYLKKEIDSNLQSQAESEYKDVWDRYITFLTITIDPTIDKMQIERIGNTLFPSQSTKIEYETQLAKLEIRATLTKPPPSLKQLDVLLRTKLEANDPEMIHIQQTWDTAIVQTKTIMLKCMIDAKQAEITKVAEQIKKFITKLPQSCRGLIDAVLICMEKVEKCKRAAKIHFLESKRGTASER